MADYVIQNGNIQMMIRDTGGWVEFWVLTDRYTYNHQQRWSGTGHGIEQFDMNNRGSWQFVGNVYIGAGAGQNVSFTMYDAGIGFPTRTHTIWAARATVPPSPVMYSATALSTSVARVNFGSGGDGGTPVREWQIGYGRDPWNPQYFVGSGGLTDIGGLSSGDWWYFWARGRNDIGWGGWSGRAQAFLWRVPDPPSPVTFDLITQTSLRTRFYGGFDGGEPVDEWQLAYGLDPSGGATATYIGSNGTNDLNNLQPGATYYFWARGRNAVGWSGWSSVRAQTLRAGALVKDDVVWKRALPYVKVNGVWRLARPYVKTGGVWRETT